ncbi:glycerophosphodiester phosphodiesterase [Luteimonas sp. BDR2-5]|uniref:glycerophosphodiester phosphodiesterase n=1 Tax=Proluteimonas luteida TaxID=2878685 RepID=UPI001E44CA7E|nr:glycerophosphodiester phosphodiesterase [Luteimonas sp. BDR2-5]MCD9027223.1 glycerophosphodiester phosphodiesterase [Luteimonas sp. BDR2-5]
MGSLPSSVSAASSAAQDSAGGARPLVVAHRGASARLPEHTLAAYRRAIEDGADAIEPDLVMTRDGVLVARHENEIGSTTDVGQRPEFADRRRTQRIDGVAVTGWFTEDFTLAELKTLRARERLPAVRGIWYDGQYAIPTLHEIVILLSDLSQAHGRTIGLMPEIKHPSHFQALGLAMEAPLLEVLAQHPVTQRAPVVVQSFEIANLRTLRGMLGPAHGNIELLQLIGDPRERPADVAAAGNGPRYRDMTTPDGLRTIAGYAQWIGPPVAQLGEIGRGGTIEPTTLVADAHAAGLRVLPYTFRPENPFLPKPLRRGAANARNEDGSIAEMRAYLALGIDGLFTDDPALGRAAVDGQRDPARR